MSRPPSSVPPVPLRIRGIDMARLGDGVLVEAHVLLMARGTAQSGHRQAPPSAVGVGYLLVLLSLWVLNVADLALTLHWTGSVGWTAEGNTIMRHVALLFGTGGFVVYKVLLMSFVVLALWWLFLRFESEAAAAREGWRARTLRGMRTAAIILTGALLTFYGWVVWNNLRIAGVV